MTKEMEMFSPASGITGVTPEWPFIQEPVISGTCGIDVRNTVRVGGSMKATILP